MNCPECKVEPGQLHMYMCDVERCPDCGYQYISCGCTSVDGRIPWSGEWPGKAECREYDLYAKFVNGWVKCSKDDPEATPDLNTLITTCQWDKTLKKWVLTK